MWKLICDNTFCLAVLNDINHSLVFLTLCVNDDEHLHKWEIYKKSALEDIVLISFLILSSFAASTISSFFSMMIEFLGGFKFTLKPPIGIMHDKL